MDTALPKKGKWQFCEFVSYVCVQGFRVKEGVSWVFSALQLRWETRNLDILTPRQDVLGKRHSWNRRAAPQSGQNNKAARKTRASFIIIILMILPKNSGQFQLRDILDD